VEETRKFVKHRNVTRLGLHVTAVDGVYIFDNVCEVKHCYSLINILQYRRWQSFVFQFLLCIHFTKYYQRIAPRNRQEGLLLLSLTTLLKSVLPCTLWSRLTFIFWKLNTTFVFLCYLGIY